MLLDLRYAARALARKPGFSAVTALTLALGIGASTTIFSVVDGVLLKPLPYAAADRLFMLWQRDQREGDREELSPANFLDVRERAAGSIDLAAVEPYGLDYTGPQGVETFRTSLVSGGFFDILGTSAQLGRTFRPEEYTAGRERVVVLSDALWRGRFGGDPAVIGRALTLDGQPFTVVGVMPASFRVAAGSDGRDVWAPKVFSEAERRRRGQGYFTAVGRLKPGVTHAAARAELDAIGRRIAANDSGGTRGVELEIVPLPEQLTAHVRPALLVLLGAAGLLLLIACANVASLMLARVLAREREFAVRLALGAGRLRLVRHVAAEGAILAAAGGAMGAVLAWWGVPVIRALSPAGLPRADELRVDGRALGFAVVTSLAAACLVCVAPALRAWRRNLSDRLKSGSRAATADPGRRRLRGGIIAGEVGLTLVLLVGAALLARSFVSLVNVERGFRADHVLAVTVFAWQGYPEPERRVVFVREVVDRLAAHPGVRAAGVTSSLPLAESITGDRATFTIDGAAPPPAGEEPAAHFTIATEGYFEALRIPLRRGRGLTAADDGRAVPVAVVNEAFARTHFPGENAVGRRITMQASRNVPPASREIVGVVADVRQSGLAADPQPAIFLPHAQAPTGALTFTVRTRGEPGALLDAVKREIWAVNPSLPIYEATTLDALVADQVRERRFHLLLLGAFAAAALVLAGVGVYGVLAQAARERTQEIGVRLALGARPADVRALVMRHAALLYAIGVGGGLFAAAALTRALRTMLFAVAPLDPVSFAGAALLVLAVAALASYLPARSAAGVDPVVALRDE